ncbi:MAG: class I SAM-dependent methyltransferase [Ferruginibacter sp.]
MKLKNGIKEIIRTIGLASVADRVRYMLHRVLNRKANKAAKQHYKDVIFPPDYYMYETYRLNYRDYYEDGKQTAMEIHALFKPYFQAESTIVLLDWGCGPGRVVGHLPALVADGSRIIGMDYNQHYIQWCSDNIKAVSFFTNPLQPPISLDANSVDGCYGLSIITHLSEALHHSWVAEFYRILKPGGVLLITTHGAHFKSKLNVEEQIVFESGNIVIKASGKEGHRVYAAFQPTTYMENLFIKNGLKILRFIPGGQPESIHGWQDTWLVQKPLFQG